MMTDGAGEATKTVEHGYHYDKTFCDGHPAPVFVPVPEEEEDEETGEIENQAEIDAAKEENRRLGSLWLNTFASCAAWASGNFSGVHFHWLMPEVDQGEIGRIASSGGEEGETPSAGTTVSAAGPRSFADSGCEADTGETYDRFIALKYSYAITEDTAREGYTLHGNHRDDLPIEVITTDASENGANASFAGIYSHEIRVNDGAVAESARWYEMCARRRKKAGWPWNLNMRDQRPRSQKLHGTEKSGSPSGRRSFRCFFWKRPGKNHCWMTENRQMPGRRLLREQQRQMPGRRLLWEQQRQMSGRMLPQ